MQHHAYVVAGDIEDGILRATEFVKTELKVSIPRNPDVIVLRYGLLSVEDARRVGEVASQKAITGDSKVIIIAASRMYHEAQNALLKVFEEPPEGTYLFLIIPTVGSLLPTLRSRVAILRGDTNNKKVPTLVKDFLAMNKEKRSAYIQKLATGKDEDDRRANRDTALLLLDGIEDLAYADGVEKHWKLLSDIGLLRSYLHDRSAPVRMILEHVSLTLPKNLV